MKVQHRLLIPSATIPRRKSPASWVYCQELSFVGVLILQTLGGYRSLQPLRNYGSFCGVCREVQAVKRQACGFDSVSRVTAVAGVLDGVFIGESDENARFHRCLTRQTETASPSRNIFLPTCAKNRHWVLPSISVKRAKRLEAR